MKYYAVDTNIILDDAENIFVLGADGNIILLTETVLEELDKFKVGLDEINYQARKFNRMLADGKVVNLSPLTIEVEGVIIKILENINYESDKNDLKIINTVVTYCVNHNIEDIVFISNDILFRTFTFLNGYSAEPFFNNMVDVFNDFNLELKSKDVLPNKEYFMLEEFEKLGLEILPFTSNFKLVDGNGKPFYFVRENSNTFKKLNDRSKVNLYNVKPMNVEQQVFIEQCMNMNNQMLVCEAKAGSGKTLLALVSAMKLKDKGLIDKIIYVRKTIISGDKTDELGFLPGNLSEKLYGYVQPMKDNLEYLIKIKNKKKKYWTKEEIEDAIVELENKYNIEYIYEGHLRGRTLQNKSFIIWDEAQNDTLAGLKTLLTRVGENSRVVIVGSLKQIDNPYVTKYNNALTYMLNNCGIFESIQIQGVNLNKTFRSKIATWTENQNI